MSSTHMGTCIDACKYSILIHTERNMYVHHIRDKSYRKKNLKWSEKRGTPANIQEGVAFLAPVLMNSFLDQYSYLLAFLESERRQSSFVQI